MTRRATCTAAAWALTTTRPAASSGTPARGSGTGWPSLDAQKQSPLLPRREPELKLFFLGGGGGQSPEQNSKRGLGVGGVGASAGRIRASGAARSEVMGEAWTLGVIWHQPDGMRPARGRGCRANTSYTLRRLQCWRVCGLQRSGCLARGVGDLVAWAVVVAVATAVALCRPCRRRPVAVPPSLGDRNRKHGCMPGCLNCRPAKEAGGAAEQDHVWQAGCPGFKRTARSCHDGLLWQEEGRGRETRQPHQQQQ